VDGFLNQFILDPLAQLTMRQMLQAAIQDFHTFTLVMFRMSGLMLVGPIYGQSIIPANLRILLILSVSFLITPVLHGHSKVGFNKLDVNRNGTLSRNEVPDHLLKRFDNLLAEKTASQRGELSRHEFFLSVKTPRSLLDYVITIAGEISLGLILGMGVMIVLSGLQMGGQLIDQQTGLSLGAVFNPGLGESGSLTGRTLFMLGTTIMLLLEPLGGHVLMMSALVETFQTLPVGDAFVSTAAIDLVRGLVHQSFALGIRIAAPLLATMSLVALAMGFLGATVPQINILVIGFPVRAISSLTILALSMSGIGEIVTEVVPETIDNLRHALTGL